MKTINNFHAWARRLGLALMMGIIPCVNAASIDGLTFTVAQHPPSDPIPIGYHFHGTAVDGSPWPPGCCAEVGDFSSGANGIETIRGLSEFNLTGQTGQSNVALSFDVYLAGGNALENAGRPFIGTIDLFAYQGNNAADLSDWGISTAGSVGSFFTGGIVVNDTLTFNITSLYNTAIANGWNSFGVRLQAAAPRDTAWTFDNFKISAVPLPPAIWLLGSGLVMLSGLGHKGTCNHY